MQLLSGQEVFSALEHHCRLASARVIFASAYVKEEAFLRLAKSVNPDQCVEKILISRWRLDDLASGASDVEIYERIKEFGWKFYIEQNLHAKTYLIDEAVILGSANLTSSGLNQQGGYPNIETMLVGRVDNEVEHWFESLLSNSVAVDDELFSKISQEVESQPKLKRHSPVYSQGVMNFLRESAASLKFYTNDMPWLHNPSDLLNSSNNLEEITGREHDIELLGCSVNPDIDQLQKAFQRLLIWRWLKTNASEPIYFGELSNRLHDALQDEPSVYRKTVKQLLQNLLVWSQELCPDRIKIDVPNVSQRIQVL